MNQRRGRGQLEDEILAAIWAANRPRTPAEIHSEIGTGLAYKTVHTVLTRLCEKGRIRRVLYGGRHCYAVVKGAAQDAADRMLAALDSAPERLAVFQHFVASLSPAEEQALRDMLRDPE